MSRDLVSSTLAGDAPCAVCTSWGAETSRHAFVSPTEGKQKYVLLFVHSFTDTHCEHVWALWRPTNPYRSQPEKARASKRAHTLQVKHKNQAVLIHREQANVNRLPIKCTERHQRAEENIHTDEWPTPSSSSQKRQSTFLKVRNDGKPYRDGTWQGLQTEQTVVGLRLRKERGPGIPV